MILFFSEFFRSSILFSDFRVGGFPSMSSDLDYLFLFGDWKLCAGTGPVDRWASLSVEQKVARWLSLGWLPSVIIYRSLSWPSIGLAANTVWIEKNSQFPVGWARYHLGTQPLFLPRGWHYLSTTHNDKWPVQDFRVRPTCMFLLPYNLNNNLVDCSKTPTFSSISCLKE